MKKPEQLVDMLLDVRPFVGMAVTGVVVLVLGLAPLAEFDNVHTQAKPSKAFYAQLIKTVSKYSDYLPLGEKPQIPFILREAMVSRKMQSEPLTDVLWMGAVDMTTHGGDTLANVEIAAQAVDMTYLSPNETFSFNDVVGIRTEEKGYKSGLMYANGELITGVGGGICMVSTMLYHAALYSGMKILDRHPHSGPVSYAKPGLDAAVAWGSLDMAFKNDTGKPVLVRATVQGEKFIVAIYGVRKPGRTVEVEASHYEEFPYKILEIEDPAVPDGTLVVERKAHVGWNVTIVRTIRQDGRIVKREVMNTDTMPAQDKIIRIPYQALPAVNLEGITPLPALPSGSTLFVEPEEEPKPEPTKPEPTHTPPTPAKPAERVEPTRPSEPAQEPAKPESPSPAVSPAEPSERKAPEPTPAASPAAEERSLPESDRTAGSSAK